MAIPIKNIYYLLSYAWNKLDERDRVAVDIDDNTELLDLFAKILINATRIILKRGIDKTYIETTQAISGIKGKFQLTESIKTSSLKKSRAVCSFDEYSVDTLINQILVSTLWRLIKTRNLDSELRSSVKGLIIKLGGISRIELRSKHFKSIKLNRNNKFYGFILDICCLIYENTLPSEDEGVWIFSDFTRDENKMNALFEKFIFNFYRIEQKEYKVKREHIYWKFESESPTDKDYLPRMETDINLERPDRKIIIDAKYYKETLATHYDKPKIHSGNLYQIFSYLLNQQDSDERTQTATGMLLYPTIGAEFDLKYSYGNHPIEVKTVNLNAQWKEIDERLREIIL